MLVEFVGLPGAGKTSLITETETRLRAAGFNASGLRELSKRGVERLRGDIGFIRRRSERISLYGALEYRKTHGEVFDFLCQAQDRVPELTLWSMELLSQLYFASDDLAGDQIAFSDEGLVHRGIAAQIGVEDQTGFDAYNAALPDDFLLVHLRVPVAIAIERAEARGKGLPATRWRKGRDPGDVMAETERLIERACEMRRARGCRVVEIDGTQPIEAASGALQKALTAALA